MKMNKKLAVIFSLIFIAALVSSPALAAEKIRLKQGVVWQTSSSYPGYVAMRDVIVKYNPDIQIAVIEIGGAVSTEEAIVQGQVDFGNSDAPDVYQKFTGTGKYAGKPPADMLRLIWCNQSRPNTVFAVKSSGVTSIQELDGKPYGVLVGSIVGDTFRLIMEALGIKPDYFEGNPGALSEAVQNRRIIGFCKAGAKESSIMQIAVRTPITVLPVTQDDLSALLKKYQGFVPATLPAGSYPGQDKDIPTWTSASFVGGTNRLPEDVVYKMVKTVYEHRKEVLQIAPRFNLFDEMPENLIKFASIPLHAGSVKFLREFGYTVPDKLLPPEVKK